jgi:hypothetical protein
MVLRNLIFAGAVVAAGEPLAAGDRLIARGLLEVDLLTCTAEPLFEDPPDTFDSLAISRDGVAYYSRSEGGRGETLHRIDLKTGVAQAVGDTGFDNIFAMAWSPAGELFASSGSPDRLLRLDVASGRATPIATVPGQMQALAFRGDGSLFGVQLFGGGHLFRIDPSTGVGFVIGTIGFERIAGIAFIDGVLLGRDAAANALIAIDLANGRGRVLRAPCPFFADDLATLPEDIVAQRDADVDGVADEDDDCPLIPDPEQDDRDRDEIGDLCDDCPDHRASSQLDSDQNGIGDLCECGDQTEDGTVDALDLVAINLAIFGAVPVSPLCDTNDDDRCDVQDIIGANRKIFGQPAYCSRYPPPGPVP